MGLCMSRKKKYIYQSELNNNIYEYELYNNIDNIIKGRLHINNKKYFSTTIYFYENYLYIINEKFNKIIYYKQILYWNNNLDNLLINFEVMEDKKMLLYRLYLYKNTYNRNVFKKINNKINEYINVLI